MTFIHRVAFKELYDERSVCVEGLFPHYEMKKFPPCAETDNQLSENSQQRQEAL